MRLIDADKIADYVCDKCGANICDRNPTYCVERDFIVACAEKMPEAVVRCKDCRWKDHCKIRGALLCDWYTDDDAYCVKGERREDAEE